jgi:hypothetical protein
MRTRHVVEAGAILALLSTAACEGVPALHPSESPSFDRSVHAQTARDDLLKALRRETARYHSTTQAVKAGYLPDDHCVEVPGLGGMGYHWLNPALLDASFDPLRPEVLVYAPGPRGTLTLGAVEYIVLDVGQPRPSFAGHPFDVGGTPIPLPHWSLHVWLYEDNPDGIFAPFNPRVSCP